MQDRTLRVRWAVVAALCLLNPVTYSWGVSAAGLTPDAFLYLVLARDFLSQGALFLTHYGHVDAGQVLPPVYPLLVVLGTFLHPDPLLVAQGLSTAALVACPPLLFLWLEPRAGLPAAAAAALAVAWHGGWMYFGTAALTEGSFILVLAAALFGADRALARTRVPAAAWLGLGAAAGALFLTRQLGLFLFGVLAALALLHGSRRAPRARQGLYALAWLAAGAAAVTGPWAVALYAQSGQGPLAGEFRLGEYSVAAPADAVPPAAAPAADYEAVYAQRRDARRLLPDASEMAGFAVAPSAPAPAPGARIAGPGELARNLAANLGFLAQSIGLSNLGLSFLAMVAIVAVPWRGVPVAARLLLPGAVAGYLLLLSLLTGLVPRYVDAIAPFVVLQVFLAAGAGLAQVAGRRALPAGVQLLAAGVLLAVVAGSYPQRATGMPTHLRYGERGNPVEGCRALLRGTEPVFAFHPMEAYLAGGRWRIVPNDSLERIAEYGRRTGTRWLLYFPSPANREEFAYYASAPWALDPGLLEGSTALVRRCESSDGLAVLYEIVA